MTGWTRLPSFVAFALLLGTASAFAQSAGADEAVTPQGAVLLTLGLTSAQKSAIYNAVVRQRVRASTAAVDPTVGAFVSRSVPLAELPGQAGIADAALLKYAMVADDVVVVDSIRMRVVDVIHGDIGH